MPLLPINATQRVTDGNGNILNQAKRTIYEAGTSTQVTVYQDEGFTTTQTQPIISNSSGIFPDTFLKNGVYRIVYKDSSDNPLQEFDYVSVYSNNIVQYFNSRQNFINALQNVIFETGSVVYAAGYGYVKDGGTHLPNLSGWSPLGNPYPDHFGENITPGSTDMKTACQSCLDAFRIMQLAPARYKIDGDLLLQNGTQIIGFAPALPDRITSYYDSTLEFTGTVTMVSCLGDKSPSDNVLSHVAISDVQIYSSGNYEWVFSSTRVSGFDLRNVRIEVVGNITGGIHTERLTPATELNRSWVMQWSSVRIRLPDDSPRKVIDIDTGDCSIIGGAFSGGNGSRISGTGGVKIVGARIDRAKTDVNNPASVDALTINIRTNDTRVTHQIIGCQIEEYKSRGIVINGDENNARPEPWVSLSIVGNTFRGRGTATADIVFINNTGQDILRGGTVMANTHATSVTPVIVSPRWKDVTILPGNIYDSKGSVTVGQFTSGQTTAAITDMGDQSNLLRLSSYSQAAGAGGGIIFASRQSDDTNAAGFAAIKGLLSSGATNTTGDIAFSGREATDRVELSEHMRFKGSTGNLLIGGTVQAASAKSALHLFNNSAPAASVPNGVVLYSEDDAGSAELRVRDEAGSITTLSPHNFSGIPEGPSEELAWSYNSSREGKTISVDMLAVIRAVEQLTGQKLVHIKES